MYRGMLYGVVSQDYSKQVVSLFKAQSVPANMRDFLSWTQKHYRTDATTSTLQRNMLFRVQVDAKSFLPRVRKNISSGQRDALFEKSVVQHHWIQLHVLNDTRITGRATYTRREIHDAYKAARMEIMNSQQCSNNPWIVLTAQLSQPPRPSQSVSDMHFNDHQTLSLRAVDPIADDGV